MDLMLLVGTVVIAGMYWRERRTSAHLRRSNAGLVASVQCATLTITAQTEAYRKLGAELYDERSRCAELTVELDHYRQEERMREQFRKEYASELAKGLN